jgi:hypothetical protein
VAQETTLRSQEGWIGTELPPKELLRHDLPAHAIAQLADTARTLAQTGQAFWNFNAAHFANPELAQALAGPFQEVRGGRGFAILRGLPVGGLPVEVIKFIYWGFGTFLGAGQSQSNLGDRIGEVTDVTHIDPHARGYRNSKELDLHTDICDIISLLAVRAAKSGGESSVASAHAIHRLFQRERPDLLETLYEGYFNHRRGEEAPGEEPVTPHRVPVFSITEGALSIRYVRPYIVHGLKAKGEERPQLIEALDVLDQFAQRVKVSFRLEPGEVLVLNNLTTLHARNAFEDWPEPERKRLILRLWLNAPGFRPQSPHLHLYGVGNGIAHVPGRTSSYAGFD